MSKALVGLFAFILAVLSVLGLGTVVAYLLYDGTFLLTRISAALSPDSTYPFIQWSAPNPGIVTIYSGRAHGSGYLTSDGQIRTAYHVVDDGISGIFFQNYQLGWGEGSCDVIDSDGPCAISSMGATAPIIHYPQVKLWQEVAIYHQEYGAWMFYQVVLVGDTASYLVGLGMDADGDGNKDFDSFVCSGMSGSPVFLSQNGSPYIYQGNLVSVGELVAIIHHWSQTDTKKCSQTVIIVH